MIDWSIRRNISLASLSSISNRILGLSVIDQQKEEDLAKRLIEATDVRPHDPGVLCVTLSGGNKQKVILSRWLARAPDILIVDNPTAGVDVGARDEFYGILRQNSESGKSFIFISEDLEELIVMTSKLFLIKDGKIFRTFERQELDHLEDNDIREIIKGL
jgi:ribose transport system ATP-binding protein